jgi:uncharacterized protein YdeI (YjbR/CyaY-like superfamily)
MAAQMRPTKTNKSKAKPSKAAVIKTVRVKPSPTQKARVNGPKTRAVRPKTARTKAAPSAELPTLSFENPAQLERWLSAHHASSGGIWLRLMKKASGSASLSYQEALGVALSFGWIDGQLKPYDTQSWLRKFCPRGARSIWSKINRDKALALIAAGEMRPAGLEQVNRAKRDGRWQAAYDSPSKAKVPADLAAALQKSPRAAAFFEQLEARNRYAVLFRVQAPKKAETRERKVRELVLMLERGEKIHP